MAKAATTTAKRRTPATGKKAASNSSAKSAAKPEAAAAPAAELQAASGAADLPTKAQAERDIKRENDRYKKDHPDANFDCQCAVGTLDGDAITVKPAYHIACQRLGDEYNQRYDGRVVVDPRMS